MSKKSLKLFKGDVPKAPIEVVEVNGKILKRKVDHIRSGHVYHPTKGWKKIRQSHQHILLSSLLLQYGIVPVES